MWVKMKRDLISTDKGFLEKGKKYNLPKDMAKDYVKNNLAKLTDKEDTKAIFPDENK